MITQPEANVLVMRFRDLGKFPSAQGAADLVEIMCRAENIQHATAAAEEIVQSWRYCPKPVELREVLNGMRSRFLSSADPGYVCEKCGGCGWLYGRINGHDEKSYSGATPCPCGAALRDEDLGTKLRRWKQEQGAEVAQRKAASR